MTLPATNRQVPDHSIMDHFNKQTYLGNQYSINQAFTASASETPILLLNNIQSGNAQILKALFQNLLKVVENTAAKSIILNVYSGPTFATIGVQTIAFVADSSGSLNNTYFLLNDQQGNKYYVWFNINSAGTDPMVAGRTGVQVTGATGATAATLGTAAKALIIALNSGLSFSATGTSTLTITNLVAGPFVPAKDSSVPTGFTFAVTAGEGSSLVPVNLRPAYGNNSIATISSSPTVSANGTLIDSISAPAQSVGSSGQLNILDAGQNLLITSIASASSTSINVIMQWFEL